MGSRRLASHGVGIEGVGWTRGEPEGRCRASQRAGLGAISRRTGFCVALLAVVAWACSSPPGLLRSYADIVAEEDARGARGLDRTLSSLESSEPEVRRWAVRALGRLEDPERLEQIAPLLEDADGTVRAAAAMAAAQAVFGTEPGTAATALAQRAESEDDPHALGSLAASLGRLHAPSGGQAVLVDQALARIAARLPAVEEDVGLAARTGFARGVEARTRTAPGWMPDGPVMDVVAALGVLEAPTNSQAAARIRRSATTALARTGALDPAAAMRALGDADWGVRRAVALAAVGDTWGLAGKEVILRMLDDADPRVQVEALKAYDRWLRPAEGCAPILERASSGDPRVAATAVDLAAAPCPGLEAQEDVLAALAAGLEASGRASGWQVPARALASLAAVAPEAAASAIVAHREHESPFARAWVARAAARAGDAETLALLSADSDPNVREAAVRGLGLARSETALADYVRQLRADDAQLVMTAVELLAEFGAPPPAADSLLSELLEALARFTAPERETLRDVRVALLGGIERAGGYAASDLEPYLTDFDAVVANRAAELIATATGARPSPSPRPLPLAEPPDAARLRDLSRSSVRLRMEGLGDVVIALRPDLAATNADRFARLAAAGYFDGLTFHRVVPNFVIQGGSPHANEYTGDGPYTRDEISEHGHWRGAVGLSTRGRDTGDAQIFVNLVDNLRLDFNYTIFGEVVEGMDVVDRVQEGAVIVEATVERR